MQISTRTHGEVLLVGLEGRLDSYTVGDVGDRLKALAEGPCLRVVLSLARLDYVGSIGLHVILLCSKRLQARGGVLAIAGARGMVATALETAGFDRLIACSPTEAEAIAGLGPR
ncbi:MAG: STAS domain-containing protein [Acetobacteraceae bacterium]|nr:STAS domain-containing protein [Acetobacteraceae bacterium]